LSQWDKLIERILSLDKNMRIEELRKVLERYGYTMQRPSGGSSHCTFRKPGCRSLTIPAHKPIKVVYVEMVKCIIEEREECSDENA